MIVVDDLVVGDDDAGVDNIYPMFVGFDTRPDLLILIMALVFWLRQELEIKLGDEFVG